MSFRAPSDFTDEEWIAAFSLILPPDRAREEGLAWNSLPEDVPESEPLGPASYDGDWLDLLSLVSDSCAERAWRLLGVTREEGERRREAFRRRVEEAQRYRDEQR